MLLNTHTYFSLKYGTLSPQQLVEAVNAAGHRAVALTDINNTSCTFAFLKAAQEAGIQAVPGIEFRQNGQLLYIGLARNEEGWRQLCALLSKYSIEGTELPRIAPRMSDVWIIYRSLPQALTHFADNEWYGIAPAEVNTLHRSPLLAHRNKLVALAPVTFMDKEGYRVHKLLRCIDLNIIIGKLQAQDCAAPDEYLLTPEELRTAYKLYPDLLTRAEALLEDCRVVLPDGLHNNRRHFTGSREDDLRLLYKLAVNGCKRRYGTGHRQAEERLHKELKVIDRMDFGAYFLITWDIVRYAHSAGYYHVGRGSGANSIVAFCLGITDVDPLELDLYFERFINPHRTSPPDFDIDFSWDERDDVTDYIFKRYGMEYTALLATYNTFKGKSIIRELGKVLGLPKADIDLIVEQPHAAEKHHAYARHIFRYGKMIEGFPNYLSIHAGGVLISERPIHYHTAQMMMPKGFPIVHFDMYAAEDMGFHKYDVLSQRGLGHIKDAVALIASNRGKAVNVHDIGRIKRDEQVRARLRSGQCIGCFYIESPAMRGLLTKLRCDNYVHLIAASSIIRPGVAKSGMMREYIERFHRPERTRYIHPVFEQHLGETFGVMVYQEDVMKIVHHFAGLDLDESDVLRRIMTGKKKSSDTFRNLMEKYFRNCRERGYPEALSQEVWRQIESFSGYSFCKAHSASFAVESFQSLYLKTYFPLEFMVAVINNFGGFYHTELYVHEARMSGGGIHAPCVNHSLYLTTLYGEDIYIGFVHIQGLERKMAEQIVREREQEGAYQSLEDFIRRVEIAPEQLVLLIRIGAFRFTGMGKCALMWEKTAIYEQAHAHVGHRMLFEDERVDYELPRLEEGKFEQAFDEIELLGFPLCSPFALLESRPSGKLIKAAEMIAHEGQRVRMLGYFVTYKPVRTVRNDMMAFGTWVDEEGQFFDSTHFPPEFRKFPFRGKGCYLLTGRIVLDFGFPGLELEHMEKLAYVKDERY
jgi:DNA-directed DNA polymerase III PolC